MQSIFAYFLCGHGCLREMPEHGFFMKKLLVIFANSAKTTHCFHKK